MTKRRFLPYLLLTLCELLSLPSRAAETSPQEMTRQEATPKETIPEAPIPAPQMIANYRAHIAGGPSVAVWYGRRVALVLDGETLDERDPATMTRICTALDETFDAYDRLTGAKPALTAPLRGRIRIEVSPKVGGGLAHHGRLGVAIGDGFFKNLYQRVHAGKNTYDQVFFYEIARNYWMPAMNPPIDYHTSKGPHDWGWWTVGFNNAMSVIVPQAVPSVDDMFYFGQSGQQFAAGMEANLNTYLAHPELYNWENSWCVPLLPWKERTSVNDLMTGLLLRLARDHGGAAFIQRLYTQIPKQRPLPQNRSDYPACRDNFYATASLAAQQDLYEFFVSDLRWAVSDAARQRVRNQLPR